MTCVELNKRTDEFRETGLAVKFPLKNRDLLIASKVRSICFRKFRWLTPKIYHCAAFCSTFYG